MRVPVPGQWIENISMEESKPEYILSYGPWTVISTGVEKRDGDGSEDMNLFDVKLKYRLRVWSDLQFTMVNNFVRSSEVSEQLDQQ